MADTRVQLEVEDWVRSEWMPATFGMTFRRERLTLRSGGKFDFDAVSPDDSIVATISTSGSLTAGGKHGVGKMMKLRSDMLFLTMVQAHRRIMVFTERDMFERCRAEKESGRVPPEVEFALAEIPAELRVRLTAAKAKSSSEVYPR